MLYRLSPTIELDTPKGPASAWAVIDYGEDHHLLWCCFVHDTGESWQLRNDVVRLRKNESLRPTQRDINTGAKDERVPSQPLVDR